MPFTGVPSSTTLQITNTGNEVYVGTVVPNLGFDGHANEVAFPSWIDPSTGTAGPTGDDVMGGPYTLPFSFPFWGSTMSEVYMCTNGFISFSSFTAASSYSNSAFPATFAISMLAPFWDDMNITGTGVTKVLLTPEYAVFAWVNVSRYNETGGTLNFEVILYPDGTIEYQYGSFTNATINSATVGVQVSPSVYTTTIFGTNVPSNSGFVFHERHMWGNDHGLQSGDYARRSLSNGYQLVH